MEHSTAVTAAGLLAGLAPASAGRLTAHPGLEARLSLIVLGALVLARGLSTWPGN